jgi:hypothetical protein
MRYKLVIILMGCVLAFSAPGLADTLELADGTLLEGRYITSNESYFIFDTGDEIKAIPVEDVAILYLSAGVEKALLASAAPEPAVLTLPVGTRLKISLSQTVDSSRHSAGHRFRGQLEGDLRVDGTTVVRRGADVFGQLTGATQARRLVGRSDLQAEFTGIMINGKIYSITTTSLEAEGSSSAAQTVGRTARGAAIGGLIGGRSGVRTGASIGAGAAILTRGDSINIPAGTLVQTTLAAPLTVQPW